VQYRPSGEVEISSHNHGFAVRAVSLPPGVEVTHTNLNDGCVEGLRAFSVQYHPEAAPGPHDAHYSFEEFIQLMSRGHLTETSYAAAAARAQAALEKTKGEISHA
jgi:carbamoyl-phosphate synthase small subunit